MTEPHPPMNNEPQKEYIVTEDDNNKICEAYKLLKDIQFRPYTSSDTVLDEKKAILNDLAIRLRREFCQDDDEEYYLSSYDFESVLEEISQGFEDEEELRQERER